MFLCVIFARCLGEQKRRCLGFDDAEERPQPLACLGFGCVPYEPNRIQSLVPRRKRGDCDSILILENAFEHLSDLSSVSGPSTTHNHVVVRAQIAVLEKRREETEVLVGALPVFACGLVDFEGQWRVCGFWVNTNTAIDL